MSRDTRIALRDPLTSFFLGIAISFLTHDVTSVSWTKDLCITSGRRKIKCAGLSTKEDGAYRIFLDSTLRTQPSFAARMLLHELLHGILEFENDEQEEKIIRRLERLLWERLTKRQKLTLIQRLPPHRKFATPSDE